MTAPDTSPGHGQQPRDREPERGGDEEPGERECDDPQSDVEDHHLIGAHEQAERQQGRVARQAKEQRDAQSEHELARVGLPARVEAERQRRAEIEERGQREYEGQREEMDENGDRDRRGAEPRDTEYEVRGEDHFRRAANRISVLLAAEALRDVPSTPGIIETPLGLAPGRRVVGDVVVPVLRAGLGMLDAVLELVPAARVGHIGLQRDEATAIASRYYSKLPPKLHDSYVLMIDPLLATGGSAAAAIDLIKHAGARTIRMICIVAAPPGVALLESQHPDVEVFTPVVDRELNDDKFIVPGLGDFGDRLYGTT